MADQKKSQKLKPPNNFFYHKNYCILKWGIVNLHLIVHVHNVQYANNELLC